MTPDFPAQRPPVIWSDPADTPEELTYRLKKNPTLYDRYQRLNRKWKVHLSDFLIGKKSLPLTYDPFFKFIFNPDFLWRYFHTIHLYRIYPLFHIALAEYQNGF